MKIQCNQKKKKTTHTHTPNSLVCAILKNDNYNDIDASKNIYCLLSTHYV